MRRKKVEDRDSLWQAFSARFIILRLTERSDPWGVFASSTGNQVRNLERQYEAALAQYSHVMLTIPEMDVND